MNPSTRIRNSGTKIHFGIIFASVVAVLVVAALVTAFAVEPPLLGWVGFGMVAIIVAGLGVVATLSIPRLRVSPPEPAVDAREQQLLVIADANCSDTALRDEIDARIEDVVAVHLVVPVRVSHLHFLANDELDETRDSEQSLRILLGLIQRFDVKTTGSVGTDTPLESMTDALGSFAATDVLLAIPPEKESYWLERELLAKARALTSVTVTQVIVPSTAPADQRAGNHMSEPPCASSR
ncbi:MAG: hypothetical protein WKF65_17005 [Gaiellaceae bacterium]